jgi:aspartokinase/homoserine dehydrogenase 1
MLRVEAVEIWTDVDGVMSADPRIVPEAVPLEALSYDELMELSHFGAKVVHPPSVHPTRAAGVPLLIRNTLRPDAPGTLIGAGPGGQRTVCGVSSIAPVALLRLEGDGMVGVPGIAMRLFGALARRGISVILISQASSEHSLCFAIEPEAVAAAIEGIHGEFALELEAGLVDPLVVEHEQAVIAAVGNGMRERPGLAGQLFGMLGARGVNVRAIAQGSSERNVSVVVAAAQRATAVRAIHGAFFGDPARLELGLVGVGRVGGALLDQLAGARRALESRGVRIALVGVASSRRLALSHVGIRPEDARAALEAGTADGAGVLVEQLARSEAPLRVLVDATASDDIPSLYAGAAGRGVAVVTANKRLPAGPLDDWRQLTGPGRRLYCETTVGAGIPVLRALRDLVETGDSVVRIEGLVSGTLGFVLDAVSRGQPLSRAVRDAWERGYTEPHPGEDLSGTDVARKALILAREAGLELEPSDVAHEPLLAGLDWAALGMEELWERLAERDGELAERQAEAAREGGRLCYLAVIDEGRVEVSLRAIGPDHPCASARGTENVIAIKSTRYCDLPLTLRGPGAGPDVTAAGLLADVLRAAVETPRGHQ